MVQSVGRSKVATQVPFLEKRLADKHKEMENQVALILDGLGGRLTQPIRLGRNCIRASFAPDGPGPELAEAALTLPPGCTAFAPELTHGPLTEA